jgi:hypothetical protein
MEHCDTAAQQEAEQYPASLEPKQSLQGSGARLEGLEVPDAVRIGIRRACDW